MADGTAIEWCDATWQPITGCSVVSPGCTNCYAMRLAGTRLRHHPSRVGLTRDTRAGPVWTGEVRFNEQWLDQPLKWSKPRRIFVCAHGDLFAEAVPDEWIDRVFAVMALAPQHTFQVLTKRSKRMREYLNAGGGHAAPARQVRYLRTRLEAVARGDVHRPFDCLEDSIRVNGWPAYGEAGEWPLPNCWMGVSVEDQARADERIPDLLATPAAVRFISAEPLLGPVDLTAIRYRDGDADVRINAMTAELWVDNSLSAAAYSNEADGVTRIDWIIVGGESGTGARPMHPEWARSLRDQCAAAGVPFFFKQWGQWVSVSEVEGPGEHYHFPDGATVRRVGKASAGRLLDGREHSGFPA